MTGDQVKQLNDIKRNQDKDSKIGLVTQLLLHLIDKDTSLSTSISELKTKMNEIQHEVHYSNNNVDDKINSATNRTEVNLIKWIVGTDIALAGTIITAMHYFG